MIFPYGEKELSYLKGKDKRLCAAIERIGVIERQITPDVFTSLVGSVSSQQISSKAAETIWARLCALLGEITPERICETPLEKIQKCGMSTRKASYIKGIGEAALSGALPLSVIPELPDGEVVKLLSSLRGVGVWTAEMLLIFSLCRPDVLSWGDLAIRRGIMSLYGHKSLDLARFERYKKRYSPYGSVASLYLWELSHS